MHTLNNEAIEEYCENHTQDEGDLLKCLERETHLKVLRPRMISGKLQGRFLSFISKLIQPRYILELGTYTGYSALCLAEGLIADGELHTIELNPELEELILKYVDQSSYSSQIFLHMGDGNDWINKLNYSWDLVFIDAEKKDYLRYYENILPKIRKGGVILVDNLLWSGKVVEEVEKSDHETQAILAFNQHVQQDPRVTNLLLPFRDGLMLIEKL
ncbi:MAG TPA: O-methyltransferase [Bacteroidales bacterium]|nr:O-methyltransferase [Bacteroidales bacterium]HOH22709.1 O-methyltransferase [Bacteroidales bacterium]HPB57385.1 O-methyltransferase [Bacteroidales bacterium]HPZ03954.1 O-methyltransferase [Bacteroidales bacterium]HQB75545.1 O-methyltransferase [Bacteroidales bacterium]